jgi:hypothetical protein
VSFAKFLFLPSWFAKLLEANFAKIIWMSSWFAKLLELLLEDLPSKKTIQHEGFVIFNLSNISLSHIHLHQESFFPLSPTPPPPPSFTP